jgi:hypothetical protein
LHCQNFVVCDYAFSTEQGLITNDVFVKKLIWNIPSHFNSFYIASSILLDNDDLGLKSYKIKILNPLGNEIASGCGSGFFDPKIKDNWTWSIIHEFIDIIFDSYGEYTVIIDINDNEFNKLSFRVINKL